MNANHETFASYCLSCPCS